MAGALIRPHCQSPGSKLLSELQVVAELQKRQNARQESMPLLDEEKDMQISEKAHRKTKKALQQLQKQLTSHTALPDLAARLTALQQKHVRSSWPAWHPCCHWSSYVWPHAPDWWQ